MKPFFFLILMLGLMLGACTVSPQDQTIQIKQPWVRAASAMMKPGESASMGQESSSSAMSANSAAYMLIENHSNSADKLLSVSSNAAQFVELHKSEMQDGVMRMMQVEYVEIPAKGNAELKPGGFHVMLIGLKQDLVAGEALTLQLNFEQAGEISIQAEVRAP